jgi:hypothetical protein
MVLTLRGFMRKIVFVCLLGFAVNALASENYCHDAAEIKTWDEVIAKHSAEPLLIKLYAMRVGLCQMVDDGKIDLDTAIDVFEEERKKLDTTQKMQEI